MTTSRNIYDRTGRLTAGTRYAGTAAFTERGISYDKAGSMLALQRFGQNASTAEDNISLTYNGMRLSSVTGTIGGQSINASFSYDDCGRTTYDGVSSLSYIYDQVGALASVSDASTSATLSTYRHLADGTKYATVSPSGGALIYRGPFTLKVADISASSPSVSFLRAETGSAGAAIIANTSGTGAAPYYYVADHIGSVRAIVDGQGNIVERNDYYAYGKRHTTGRTYATLANSQLLFSGKEDLGQALDLASGAAIGTSDLRVLDFGARHYDPIVPRWTTQDPLAEKYFPINPYVYCAGDPVNLLDPKGMSYYTINKNGEWIKEETNDPYDVLISENGAKLYIVNKSIMENMKPYKFLERVSDDLDPIEKTMHFTVVDNLNELKDVFFFLADNTDVEWLCLQGENGQGLLATQHRKAGVDENAIGFYTRKKSNDVLSGNPIEKIHNHPTPYKSELSSMEGDFYNVSNHPETKSYVYFSATGNIYQVKPDGIELINKRNK